MTDNSARNSKTLKRERDGFLSPEMAALCPGVQYGLSSQQNCGENNDLIFVKLTDSALRAIEEYIKNQNKFNHKPTIKFLGNENGELSFPSMHHQMGSTSFSFSMSSTADMEGPGGSFECIKQVGPPRGPLEALGSIPHKIRIHANDDVYEVTRTRMTEAEDKYKNKCTREIKPNQTDIGRKVKVKHTNRAPVHPARKEMPSMRESLLKQPSYHSNAPSKPIPPIVHSSTNGLSNGLGSNHVSSSRPQLNRKPSIPEIPRRPPTRKPQPQTLTPPGGSDGSSGSGQSPTSTHPGSPPLITSSKRPGFHDGPDGFPYKRQRIAHTNKQVDQTYQSPFENNSQRRPVTDSRDASNMNPRSRESPAGVYAPVNSYSNGMLNDKPNSSDDDDDDDDDDDAGKKSTCDSHSSELSQEKTIVDRRSISPGAPVVNKSSQEQQRERSTERQNGYMNQIATNRVRRQAVEKEVEKERNVIYNKVTSSTENRIVRVSPDSQTDSIPPADLDPPLSTEKENEEFPDYEKQYVTIRDLEQRRKYKNDYIADYNEYRVLHAGLEKVSDIFCHLGELLKKENEKSSKYKAIKKQIVKEYREKKKDFEHQKAKRRFYYLHAKLSHIKKLVSDFDQEMVDLQY
nr:RNA polymerase II elongation factor Ell-like [Leptinotarsa decemlineata]